MSRDQGLVERLSDEKAHSKCVQPMFGEKAKRPTEKFRFAAEWGRGKRKRRGPKHQEEGDV